MRNKIKFAIFGLALAGLMGSCQSSNDVASNRSIQKRKYNDGYYISFNKNNRQRVKEEEKLNNIPSEDQIADVIEQSNLPQADVKTPDTKNFVERIEVEEVGGIGAFDQIYSEEEYSKKEKFTNGLARTVEFLTPRSARGPINQLMKRKTAIGHEVDNSPGGESGAMLVLLVILALIIPPLAVFIYEGASGRFWIDLILAILGWGAWGFFGGIFWICGLAAVIYALLIVLGVI